VTFTRHFLSRSAARVLLAAATLPAAPCGAQDTGPEYLESAPEQDPLSNGFVLFKLPFERKRENLLHLRTFYQDRTLDGADDREDWAGGGWAGVVGSYWDSSIKLAATAYTSQKLYADDDKQDTGSLQDGHQGYSVLGEVYGSLTLDKLALQAGRYAVNLPYINMHDIRMTPQTFQAAHAVYEPSDGWAVGGGVVTHIKARTRDGFDSLYKSAGLEGDEDVYVAASVYQKEPGTLAGLYAMHAPEYLNGAYLELSKRFWLNEQKYIQLSGQYTRMESTGDELDGNFTVNHYGARITWKDGWYSGSLAYTDYPEQDRLRSPWGGVPGYTSVLINDFNRPEESAWLLGGTVDFDNLGARGLAINAKAVFGDTPDCGNTGSPDRDEYNLNVNYKPPLPKLAGLLLQLRFGWVELDETCGGEDVEDFTEVRFVTNYAFDF
jgi:hypothetical protein